MPTNKITNNLKVHGENTTQKYTDLQYSDNIERINGVQPGTTISSNIINTGLRQSTLVSTALIDALKALIPTENDLVNSITVGSDTQLTDLTNAFIDALAKIKVQNAILADNVKSGAIVEETTRAWNAKQGKSISLNLNSKTTYKGTWEGTYKNNDIVYYNVGNVYKGLYLVKGLTAETETAIAGTLTITTGSTPQTYQTNLTRLTFETNIGIDGNLSKTDTVNVSSTTNQLLTAIGAFNNLQGKVAAGDGILTQTSIAGSLGTLVKSTTITSTSTDGQLPTSKAVYNHVLNVWNSKLPAGNKILTQSTTGNFGTLEKITWINDKSTDEQLPTAKSVYMYILSNIIMGYTKTVTKDEYSRPITSGGVYDFAETLKSKILWEGSHIISSSSSAIALNSVHGVDWYTKYKYVIIDYSNSLETETWSSILNIDPFIKSGTADTYLSTPLDITASNAISYGFNIHPVFVNDVRFGGFGFIKTKKITIGTTTTTFADSTLTIKRIVGIV